MYQWMLPLCSDYSAYWNCSLVHRRFSYALLCDSRSSETSSFCLWSFSSLWTQAEGPGQAAVDGVQCICVGAVYRIPLSGQECTAWLWNPPHGCDSLFCAGVSIQPVCHIITKRETKNRALFWHRALDCSSEKGQVMTLHEIWLSQVFILHGCCSQRVTPWRIHMITSTQWNETYWNVTQMTLDICPGSTLA